MIEPCSINHLPTETLLHIMGFLEPKDLAITESVSRVWQEASNCSTLWRRHCEAKYEQNYLALVGNPHPKAAWLLPIYIRSFQHALKPLPVQLSEVFLAMELHGQYLIQRDKTWIGNPCSKIKECHLIYDLIRQEQIPIPKYFEEASFIKWTVCNKNQAIVVQDKEGRLIYSEPPFDRQITYNSFNGSVLNVAGKYLFYTSENKMQLSILDLNSGQTTFTMGMDRPIKSFFASEFAYAAILDDQLMIFHDTSDLSKNFKIHYPLGLISLPGVLSNQNWFIVACERYDRASFHACNLVTGKCHTDLYLPIGCEKVLSQYALLPCTGLELCRNYFFVSDTDGTVVLDLGNLDQENNYSRIEMEFCEFSRPLSTFGDQFFFFLDPLKEKICFTDVFTHKTNQMDLDLLQGAMIDKTVINGRFIVVSIDFGETIKFCDLLAPERFSSKHFLSLKDKQIHKKKKA